LIPTVPVTAPGKRIEPPVSEPIASGDWKEETTDEEPPPDYVRPLLISYSLGNSSI
jgi:hypothetical protein